MTNPTTLNVEGVYPQARAAFALEVCALERDVRLSDLTEGEIDSIIHAIISLPAVRAALLKEKDHPAAARAAAPHSIGDR